MDPRSLIATALLLAIVPAGTTWAQSKGELSFQEMAASAWCHRMTNGIAEGKLTLTDLQGLNSGDVSVNAAAVLKVPVAGE